jgi:uroporphyrinogen decarboxylase
MEMGGATGRIKNQLVARAVTEGLYPHGILLGEDICSQQGPMISPEFLEKYYAPQLKRGLEPLLEVGCKPVWHSDGNIRPLMDMLIDCGVQGFQGFQPECGMTLDFILKHRTREGKPLLLFGPMAVTTELPVMKPAEVKKRVRDVIAQCEGQANLVLFTSNTINPDITYENVIAMYETVLEG